jgi:hypothetical protein
LLLLSTTEDCHLPKVMNDTPKNCLCENCSSKSWIFQRETPLGWVSFPFPIIHILWDWNANTNVHVLTKFAGPSWCPEFHATSTQKSWNCAFFLKTMHGRITKLQVEVLSVFNAQSCAEKLHRRTLRFKRWVYIDQSCVQKAFWSVSAWKGDIFLTLLLALAGPGTLNGWLKELVFTFFPFEYARHNLGILNAGQKGPFVRYLILSKLLPALNSPPAPPTAMCCAEDVPPPQTFYFCAKTLTA